MEPASRTGTPSEHKRRYHSAEQRHGHSDSRCVRVPNASAADALRLLLEVADVKKCSSSFSAFLGEHTVEIAGLHVIESAARRAEGRDPQQVYGRRVGPKAQQRPRSSFWSRTDQVGHARGPLVSPVERDCPNPRGAWALAALPPPVRSSSFDLRRN